MRIARIAPLFILLVACTRTQPVTTHKLTVAATFYPLAHFAEQVGGEHVQVINMTPNGIEPHDYEPTPQDLAELEEVDLFLYNGAGLDPWAETIAPNLAAKGITTLRATERIDLLEGHDEHEEEEQHEATDPHAWLDPTYALYIVGQIRDELVAIDPENAATYNGNAATYVSTLQLLEKHYREDLADCTLREIIVSHDAYRYMATRYDFATHAIAGLSPDEEPSAQRIAELADLAKEKGIDTIFFEELVSPDLAQTIADEVGAQTNVLHTIEGLTPGQSAGATYMSLMYENLESLKLAMHCQ